MGKKLCETMLEVKFHIQFNQNKHRGLCHNRTGDEIGVGQA